ncbi:MAG: TetR/AcrR family transcriptional regulator [Firmicutes bacterium]|nr:TetR/AcrR family transcriptional regulator [Bacillota bacterium]
MEEQKAQPVDPKQRIMEAAEKLFADKGFDAVSIREIADQAQVNSAMLYYYFGSKLELFRAVIEYSLNELSVFLKTLIQEAQDPVEQLKCYLKGYVKFFIQNPKTGFIINRIINFKDSDIFAVFDHYWIEQHWILDGILQAGIEAGVFRPFDTRLASVNLRSSIITYVNWGHVFNRYPGVQDHRNFCDDRLADEMIDQFLNGVLDK